MKALIEKITPAIMGFRKVQVKLNDGHKLVVHPHIVIKKKEGREILKSVLESGDCMDIPLHKIAGILILEEGFAIDSACLNFDFEEYELVFPKKGDWFQQKV